MNIHSKISRSALLEMSNNFFGDLGTLLDPLVGMVFLRKAHLALALKVPLLEHLLTFFVFLQARYIAEFELSVGWNICLGSEDHDVANKGPAYKGIAAMIDIRSAYPYAHGAGIFGHKIIWGVGALPVVFVRKARESERIIDNPMLNESTVEEFVSRFRTRVLS